MEETPMKKIFASVLVLCLIFALASTAFADDGFVFKQGFDLDYPPYSYLQDDGSVGGFDVELCQAVCEYLGWGYEPVPFNWDVKDAELNSGSCDCIWSGFTVEGREDDYVWSIPYSNNKQMILVADDSGITTLADLAGKIVGVQKAGAIDAIAIDITAGSFLKADDTGFSFLEETLGDESYAVGFRLGDEELCEQINTALLALAENGKMAEIASNEDYAEIIDMLTLIDVPADTAA